MDKRGVYFFVIDAIIAGAILFATLMFIFSTHTVTPDREPTLRVSEDFLQYITTTKLREYESVIVDNMILDRNISNLDNTLLDQMVIFYYLQNNESLAYFVDDVASRIVAQDRGLLIYINDQLAYNSTGHKSADTLNSSNLVITSKKMGFHRVNWTTVSEPIWVEVKVWT